MQRLKDILSSGRALEHLLVRFSLPVLLARRLTKFVRILFSTKEFIRRRRMIQNLEFSDKNHLRHLKANGVTLGSCTDFDFGRDVLCTCKLLTKERLVEGKEIRVSDRRHLVNLLRPEDLSNNPCLINFAISEPLVALVSRYLHEVPILADMQLWWSGKNDKTVGSQLFHFDQEDYSTIRLYLLVNDVNSDSGALTYFDKNVSETIRNSVPKWYERISDEALNELQVMNQVRQLTGSSGTLGIVDTARCCHMGSRVKSGERLVFMLHYVSFQSIKEPVSSNIIRVLESASLATLTNSDVARALLHHPSVMKIRKKVS